MRESVRKEVTEYSSICVLSQKIDQQCGCPGDGQYLSDVRCHESLPRGHEPQYQRSNHYRDRYDSDLEIVSIIERTT